jgi:predicted ATPase with chaperone activity
MDMSTVRLHDGALTRRRRERPAWVTTRPCRAPHQTLSAVGLIGPTFRTDLRLCT